MSKRLEAKKVEAWAVVDNAGVIHGIGQTKAGAIQEYGYGHPAPGAHMVKFAPYDPAAERERKEVRREVVLALDLLRRPKNPFSNGEAAIAALTRAVAVFEKARKGRR